MVVGTCGRLIDLLTLSNGKVTNLRRVSFIILDEADRLMDMGFNETLVQFMNSTNPKKQIAMFS